MRRDDEKSQKVTERLNRQKLKIKSEHIMRTLLSRGYMYTSSSCSKSSCVFTQGGRSTINYCCEGCRQEPYILLKEKQSLSITHIQKRTHLFSLTFIWPCPSSFFKLFCSELKHYTICSMGTDDMCTKCLDVLYSAGAISPFFPYLKLFIKRNPTAISLCGREFSSKGIQRSEQLTAATSDWPMRLFLRLWLWILLFSVWQGSPTTTEESQYH